jgi:hypothetical protein
MSGLKELIEAAKRWAERGFQVVPLKLALKEDGDKRLEPFYKWKSEPYQGFERLKWEGANAYGIVLGPTQKGWLAYVDVDLDAPVKSDPFTTLMRAFPELQDTYIEKTPHGFHVFLYLDKPSEAKNINFKPQWGLELHVSELAIMAPSKYEGGSYTVYHDAEPVKISDFYEKFNEKFSKPQWFNLPEKPKGGYKGRNPPCIEALLEGVEEGIRNETGIRLAAYFLNFRGLARTKALAYLQEWNNKNRPPMPQNELNNILKSVETHGYIYGCQDELLSRFCNVEACPFGEAEEAKSKVVHTPSAELPDGRLIEETFDGKDVYFLVYNPQTGQVEKAKEIECEGIVYRPINSPEVCNGLVLLPSEAQEYESEEKLFQEVLDFLNRWHHQPNEFERKLDAFYVFLSYVYDLLPKLPYRRALGAYGRGKTAWLDTVGSICYRPMVLAGCDTDKAIVRMINNFRGTSVVDEADFGKSSLYAFIVKILNVGYDKRLGFYARADENNPKKVLIYNVFGPKILATRKEFYDAALESRCLTFIAQEKTKPMPLFRDKKFLAEALALRNKLILWRFRKYNELKAKIEALETPEIDLELKVSSSRIKEVLTPLLLLNPDFKREIEALAQELEEQLKASDADWQLEEALKDVISRVYEEVPIGETGSEGLLASPVEEKEGLSRYMQIKTEKVILRIPLVKLAKIILDNPNPDSEELKSLNQKLSRIAKTRLGLKVVKDRKRRTILEVPWGLAYRPSAPIKPIGTPTIKVIELDDKHPFEKQEPIIVSPKEFSPEENEKRLKVWNALAEASLIRGSAFLDEVVQATGLPENEVKAILEQFQREGRAYSPHPDAWKISQPPEKSQIKVVAWLGLTAKIISWQAWKATEQLHRLKRNLQLELDFPDNTKIKVTGALTWFIAKLKAVELFGDWRKRLNLTRDSTLPGCIGLGKPIPPNTCETCAKYSDFTCEELKQKGREYFKQFIQIKYRRFYADVYLYLCETPFRLTPDGWRALWLLIFRYITNHKENKRIHDQYFAITDDYAAFSVVSSDTTSIIDAILNILEKPENMKRVGRVVSVISEEA